MWVISAALMRKNKSVFHHKEHGKVWKKSEEHDPAWQTKKRCVRRKLALSTLTLGELLAGDSSFKRPVTQFYDIVKSALKLMSLPLNWCCSFCKHYFNRPTVCQISSPIARWFWKSWKKMTFSVVFQRYHPSLSKPARALDTVDFSSS